MMGIAALNQAIALLLAIGGDCDQLQRVMASVRFALLKIPFGPSHCICDMGHTQHRC